MNNVRIQILDYQYDSSGRLNKDKSVLGDLDVSIHSEFPLAITFSTSDIRDIGARKGSFSKTFKVPATKKNNRLLKSIYIPSSVTQATVTGKKDCKIIVNNLYSLEGQLQLTAIVVDNKPVSYSCIFFGDNIGWATLLDKELIKDIDWGPEGEDLENVLTSYVDPTNPVSDSHKGIKDTWAQDDATTVLSGYTTTIPYVYPIVSYGGYNLQGIDHTIQLFSQSFYYGAFVGKRNGNLIPNPDPVVDWRPCLWIYTMFKKIFEAVGYNISSDFIESDMFKKLLYCLPNFKYNNVGARYDSYAFESTVTGDYDIIDLTGEKPTGMIDIDWSSNTSLNEWGSAYYLVNPSASSDFNNPIGSSHYSSDVFTVPEYGYYSVLMKNYSTRIGGIMCYETGTTDPIEAIHVGVMQISATLLLQVQTVSDPAAGWVNIESANSTGDIPANNNTSVTPNLFGTTGYINLDFPNLDFTTPKYFNKGDKIRVLIKVAARVSHNSSNSPPNYDIEYNFTLRASTSTGSSSSYNIPFNAEYVEYGQTFNLTDVLDPEQKQIDFIKGIAHAFNLQFTTDEGAKTVFIEPFDTFYKPLNESVDWTQKVDLSKEQTDKWTDTNIKRNVIFKYKEDSKDIKVKARGDTYWDDIPDEYPFQETLSNEFEKGDSVFENPFFSGTFNALDADTYQGAKPYNAVLWEENVSPGNWNRPVKGYEFQPRLLYWEKYSPNWPLSIDPPQANIEYFAQNVKHIIARSSIAAGGAILSNVYPQATSINRWDIDSPVLSYGNVWVTDLDGTTATFSPAVVGEGLYYTYYKQMFEMLKNNPRIKVLYVNLKITDIINLDMQKLVYIDGTYWRINKIIDFKPQANELTKVELIKWETLGELTPAVPQDDGGGGTSPPIGV